ncbi:hypothetical protein D3C84_1017170 [compost metagenome]
MLPRQQDVIRDVYFKTLLGVFDAVEAWLLIVVFSLEGSEPNFQVSDSHAYRNGHIQRTGNNITDSSIFRHAPGLGSAGRPYVPAGNVWRRSSIEGVVVWRTRTDFYGCGAPAKK